LGENEHPTMMDQNIRPAMV